MLASVLLDTLNNRVSKVYGHGMEYGGMEQFDKRLAMCHSPLPLPCCIDRQTNKGDCGKRRLEKKPSVSKQSMSSIPSS